MTQNQTYKAFLARPSHVLDLSGETLDGALVLAELAPEAQNISSYAIYIVRNDEALGGELARITAAQPASAGRQAGAAIPDFLATGKPGKSRKENLLRYNMDTPYRPYQEHVKTTNSESPKYVSQERKHTTNKATPTYREDYVNLETVDRRYATIENKPPSMERPSRK